MKTIFRITYLLLGVSLLSACKPKEKTVTVDIIPLKESSLYNADDVYRYIEKNMYTNRDLALEYYNKSLESEQPLKTYYTKRSLTLYPDYMHYQQLGEVLYAEKKYKEMNELYRMLVFPLQGQGYDRKYLFERPNEGMVENYVVSNILAYSTVWKSRGEQLALTDSIGIKMDDLKQIILKDNRITLFKPTEENRNILWEFLTTNEKMQYFKNDSTLEDHTRTIYAATGEFEIDKNIVQQHAYADFEEGFEGQSDDASLETRYGDLVLEKKDAPARYFDYNFERHFSLNDSIKVLIYGVDTSSTACPKDMRHIYHRLVVYWDDGHGGILAILANMIVAVQSGEELETVKFNHDKFTVTSFKRYWEKPYKKGDYDNHVNKIEQTGEKSYVIDKGNGKISLARG